MFISKKMDNYIVTFILTFVFKTNLEINNSVSVVFETFELLKVYTIIYH